MKVLNKKMISSLFLSALLNIFLIFASISCTHSPLELNSFSQRSIAQDSLSSYELNDLIEKSLEITKTKKQDSNTNYHLFFHDKDFALNMTKVDFVKNELLSKDTAYKIIPYLKDNKYYIQIQYSPLALNDKGAFNELKIFFSYFNKNKMDLTAAEKILKAITGKETYRESAFFEVLHNAKKGYIPAISELLSLRVQAKSDNFALFKEKRESLKKHTTNNKIDNQLLYNSLQELNNDSQFLKKIANNERKAVAEIIEKKIPWNTLSPFEKSFWQNQLDIMKNPVPLHQKVLVYRGLKTRNLIDSTQNNLDRIYTNQSFYQLANFFHNTKKIDPAYLDNNLVTSYISNDLKIHSLSSEQSFFISLTPTTSIAKGFSEDALGIFAIDPRALFFNETSTFIDENEFLTSFITFPEDSLALVELTGKDKTINPVQGFILENRISQTIVGNLNLRKHDGDKLYAQLKKNTSHHFKIFNSDIKNKKSVFRTLLQQGMQPPLEVMKKETTSLIRECKNLIKKFF